MPDHPFYWYDCSAKPWLCLSISLNLYVVRKLNISAEKFNFSKVLKNPSDGLFGEEPGSLGFSYIDQTSCFCL